MARTKQPKIYRSWVFYERNGAGMGKYVRIIDVDTSNKTPTYHWVADPQWYTYPNPEVRNKGKGPCVISSANLPSSPKAQSDFLCIDWSADSVNLRRKNARIVTDTNQNRLYEVVNCLYIGSEAELRRALDKGITYQGRLADHVLVVYRSKEENFHYRAIDFTRRELEVRNGALKLLTNNFVQLRSININKKNIQQIPRSYELSDRYVYTSPILQKTSHRVIVSLFSRYAQSYVEQFITRYGMEHTGSSRTDTITLLNRIADDPKSLSNYLGGMELPEDAIDDLKAAAQGVNDPEASRIFHIVQQIVEKRAAALDTDGANTASHRSHHDQTADHNHENASAEVVKQQAVKQDPVKTDESPLANAGEQHRSQADELARVVDNLKEQRIHLESGITQLTMRDQQLKETTGTQTNSSQLEKSGVQIDRIQLAPMCVSNNVESIPEFHQAISRNLQALGVYDWSSQDQQAAIKQIANCLRSTLTATRMLCIDSTFASSFANALSFAIRGKAARHAGLPANWSHTGTLESLLDKSGTGVVVLDNALDTVNESVLFALSRRTKRMPVIIIPVGSKANMRLVAPEIWAHMFWIPTNGLIQLPATTNTLYKAESSSVPPAPDTTDLLSSMRDLAAITKLVPSELVLTATITTAAKNTKLIRKWVCEHVCLQTSLDQGEQAALKVANTIDTSMSSSVRQLLHGVYRG